MNNYFKYNENKRQLCFVHITKGYIIYQLLCYPIILYTLLLSATKQLLDQ